MTPETTAPTVPAPGSLTAWRDWAAVSPLVVKLRAMALRGLARMFRADEGLFAFTARRSNDRVVLEGVSRPLYRDRAHRTGRRGRGPQRCDSSGPDAGSGRGPCGRADHSSRPRHWRCGARLLGRARLGRRAPRRRVAPPPVPRARNPAVPDRRSVVGAVSALRRIIGFGGQSARRRGCAADGRLRTGG